jgi:hypothetical protein
MDTLTFRQAETIRRAELLEAYNAFQDWDSDSIVVMAHRLQERLGISYIEANDILFDAFWLAGQIRDAD